LVNAVKTISNISRVTVAKRRTNSIYTKSIGTTSWWVVRGTLIYICKTMK